MVSASTLQTANCYDRPLAAVRSGGDSARKLWHQKDGNPALCQALLIRRVGAEYAVKLNWKPPKNLTFPHVFRFAGSGRT